MCDKQQAVSVLSSATDVLWGEVMVIKRESERDAGGLHKSMHVEKGDKPQPALSVCLSGAMLTHGNLIANSAGTCTILTDYNPGDKHISYLPLAHIYERVNLVTAIHLGASVGFYAGNVQVRALHCVVPMTPPPDTKPRLVVMTQPPDNKPCLVVMTQPPDTKPCLVVMTQLHDDKQCVVPDRFKQRAAVTISDVIQHKMHILPAVLYCI